MGRRKPAWQKQREADLALAREQALRAPKPAPTGAIIARPTSQVGYRSLILADGTENIQLAVRGSTKAITKFGVNTLGITDPAPATAEEPPEGFTPSLLLLTVGDATATRETTSYGSGYIRYSASTTGDAQAHFRAPVSVAAGVFTPADLVTPSRLAAYRTASGSAPHTRLYLQYERSNTSLL